MGAWNSGTLGYFRDRVVNLDGKVNKCVLGQNVVDYLARQHIDWICDIKNEARAEDWILIARSGNFTLFSRAEGAIFAASRLHTP